MSTAFSKIWIPVALTILVVAGGISAFLYLTLQDGQEGAGRPEVETALLLYSADLSRLDSEERIEIRDALKDAVTRALVHSAFEDFSIEMLEGIGGLVTVSVELPESFSSQVKEAVESLSYLEFWEEKEGAGEIQERNRRILAGEEEGEPEEVLQPTPLTGRFLQDAQVLFQPVFDDESQLTQRRPVVQMQFSEQGAQLLQKITGRNLGKTLALYLDGEILHTFIVQEEVKNGRVQVSGNLLPSEATEIAENLRKGQLPAPLTPWRTYQNDESGFSIQVPPSFQEIGSEPFAQFGLYTEDESKSIQATEDGNYLLARLLFSSSPYGGQAATDIRAMQSALRDLPEGGEVKQGEAMYRKIRSIDLDGCEAVETELSVPGEAVSGGKLFTTTCIKEDGEYIFLSMVASSETADRLLPQYEAAVATFTFQDGAPEPLDTSGWSPFRHELFGIEFKYPTGFFVEPSSESGIMIASDEWRGQSVHHPATYIYSLEQTDLSLEAWLQQNGTSADLLKAEEGFRYYGVKDQEPAEVDGRQALRFGHRAVSGGGESVLVKGVSNAILEIQRHNSGAGDFDQRTFEGILSTIRFLKGEEEGDPLEQRFPDPKERERFRNYGQLLLALPPVDERNLCIGDNFVIRWSFDGPRMTRVVTIKAIDPGGETRRIDTALAAQNETGSPSYGVYVWKVGDTREGITLLPGPYEIIVENPEYPTIPDSMGLIQLLVCDG